MTTISCDRCEINNGAGSSFADIRKTELTTDGMIAFKQDLCIYCRDILRKMLDQWLKNGKI